LSVSLHNKNGGIPQARGFTSFAVGDRVDFTKVDSDHPIRPLHPVFLFSKLDYANVLHVSDIHVSARQAILARSNARVIEFERDGKPEALEVSPELGPLVNRSDRNLVDILSLFAIFDDDEVTVCDGRVTEAVPFPVSVSGRS